MSDTRTNYQRSSVNVALVNQVIRFAGCDSDRALIGVDGGVFVEAHGLSVDAGIAYDADTAFSLTKSDYVTDREAVLACG